MSLKVFNESVNGDCRNNILLFPLIIFVLLEVVFFGNNVVPQAIVSSLEYLILAILGFNNIRLAIAYFISFTLLSFGAWSYIVEDVSPNNFWGLRIFNISFNLLFSIFLSLIYFVNIYISGRNFKIIRELYFLLFFYFSSLFLGLINLYLEINYFDNFSKDFMIYTPLLFNSLLISSLNSETAFKIFRFSIITTLFAMLLSFLLGIYFEYGSGLKFILINSFGYFVLFLLPISKKQFHPFIFFILSIAALVLLISGKIFVGGKFIIILFLSILWYFLVFKKHYFLIFSLLFSLINLYIFWSPVTIFLFSYFEDNFLIQYKLSQVISVVSIFDIDLLARTPTSMGNIIAEGSTLLKNLSLNPIRFLSGLGFGGGISDYYGYLSPSAKPGLGYAEVDAVRNNFFRMHLPFFEFFLKGGIIAGLAFFYFASKYFTNGNIFSFFFFLVFFTVFTNNKEMTLLAFLFVRLSLSKKVC